MHTYGIALMQHCTRSLLTGLSLEDWLVEITKNTCKSSGTKQLEIASQTRSTIPR